MSCDSHTAPEVTRRKASIGHDGSRTSYLAASAALCVAGVFVANNASAAIEEAPAIGSKVPAFELTDVSGKAHKLNDYAGKTVVLSFTSQRCPVSRAEETDYAKLAETYSGDDVVFLSIDSAANNSIEEIAAYADATWEEGDMKNETGKKLPYPILKDEGNAYADKMGAKRTPEVYIVDKEGNLAYHGGIDNQKKPDDPAYKNYVAEALDALKAGEAVPEPKTNAYGCGINRK